MAHIDEPKGSRGGIKTGLLLWLLGAPLLVIVIGYAAC